MTPKHHAAVTSSAFRDATATGAPMNVMAAQHLDRTVVNARRRFERVLAAWASDVLALDRARLRSIRWRRDTTSEVRWAEAA